MNKLTKVLINDILNNRGIDLSVYEPSYTSNMITKRMAELDITDIDSFIFLLNKNDNEFNHFYASFLNGYSIFFREKITFDFLFVSLVRNMEIRNKELRVWSMGCSKGQEAYSFVILFEEIKRYFELEFKYIVFATDTSLSALDEAKLGIYNESELKNLTLNQIEIYFDRIGEKYKFKKSFKSNVSFSRFDIVLDKSDYPKESIYGDFDFIMCSNLLIYYNKMVQIDIVDKLVKSSKNNGLIISSLSEIDVIEQITDTERELIGVPIIQKRVD